MTAPRPVHHVARAIRPIPRHREKRSDQAIQRSLLCAPGWLRFACHDELKLQLETAE